MVNLLQVLIGGSQRVDVDRLNMVFLYILDLNIVIVLKVFFLCFNLQVLGEYFYVVFEYELEVIFDEFMNLLEGKFEGIVRSDLFLGCKFSYK